MLAIARREGYVPYALSFRYGQRHSVELDAARRVAEAQGVARHVVADIDLRVFGGSALTDDIDVPHHDSADDLGDGIPVTYVPARNTIFLSFALAWAETLGCERHLHRRQRARLQRLPGLPARVHRGVRADGEPRHQGGRGGPPAV